MTIHDVKCAKCNVPIEGPVDAKPESAVSCPVCGISDTLENVNREAAEYVTSKAADALSDKLAGVARGSKFMTYKQGPRNHKIYRFVVDYSPDL
ncbi:MAG: hypothetical protein Q8N31_06095 [Reyranella sp.]|nr:hypothetical protein [Reyranella sp.]MDP3159567.1 hypothetical protein [Reyranella sp.]